MRSGSLAAILFAGGISNVFCQPAKHIDFQKDIAPIIEKNCLQCHSSGSHISLASRQDMLSKELIVPGKGDDSPLFSMVDSGKMPPGQKLPADQIKAIHQWIQEGAVWPDGVALKAASSEIPKAANSAAPADEHAEVAAIRERILANKGNPEGTKQYKVTIPNTGVSYEMIDIPAGDFNMGSTAQADEQPVHKVSVPTFWMQAHEVTWDEYRLFMFANQAGEIAHKDATVDAVSRPTRPYVEMSFGMGINGFPAISMTQHAANKYAEWLSSKTGEFYRLPTEAEWEYACRANAPAPSPLSDYAWFSTDSSGKYQKVATKKPNAWGLFDMLGNVMEWTADQYVAYKPGEQKDPWEKPTEPYPIAVRGGSWNDPAAAVTCSVRVQSDASWKQQDPQLPKSIWYETDAQWLGFRLVRPATVPSAEEMYRYWNNDVEHDEQ
jgi:formylglycine-generating enzyme required for sulfatase activity